MDYIHQRKYLLLLASQLPGFHQTNQQVWNCRCPICGDSQHSTQKMRGYFFVHKGDILYKCHNCDAAYPLAYMVRLLNPVLYKQMLIETVRPSKETPAIDDSVVEKLTFRKPTVMPIRLLREGDATLAYLLGRNLDHAIHRFLHVSSIRAFGHTISKYEGLDLPDIEAVGIPYMVDGKLCHLQCRAIDDSERRYTTFELHKHLMLFGFDDCNHQERVSVLEGPFDACFVENAIACGGPPNKHHAQFLKERGIRARFIYDADYKKNQHIKNQLLHRIEEGHDVCLFDDDFPFKDLNEAAQNGWSLDKIADYLDSHTYGRLKARLQLAR